MNGQREEDINNADIDQLRTLFNYLIQDQNFDRNLGTFTDEINAVANRVGSWVSSQLTFAVNSLEAENIADLGPNGKKAFLIEFIRILVNSMPNVGAQRLDRHHWPTDLRSQSIIDGFIYNCLE